MLEGCKVYRIVMVGSYEGHFWLLEGLHSVLFVALQAL